MKTVTGGVGTIKRKRELRELLEQQDVDYEDDIFDSTPFKRKKDLKVRLTYAVDYSTIICIHSSVRFLSPQFLLTVLCIMSLVSSRSIWALMAAMKKTMMVMMRVTQSIVPHMWHPVVAHPVAGSALWVLCRYRPLLEQSMSVPVSCSKSTGQNYDTSFGASCSWLWKWRTFGSHTPNQIQWNHNSKSEKWLRSRRANENCLNQIVAKLLYLIRHLGTWKQNIFFRH